MVGGTWRPRRTPGNGWGGYLSADARLIDPAHDQQRAGLRVGDGKHEGAVKGQLDACLGGYACGGGSGIGGGIDARGGNVETADGEYVVDGGGQHQRGVEHAGKVHGLCKIGGLIGYVGGTLNMSDCSVSEYVIENYEANIKNYYSIQTILSSFVVL